MEFERTFWQSTIWSVHVKTSSIVSDKTPSLFSRMRALIRYIEDACLINEACETAYVHRFLCINSLTLVICLSRLELTSTQIRHWRRSSLVPELLRKLRSLARKVNEVASIVGAGNHDGLAEANLGAALATRTSAVPAERGNLYFLRFSNISSTSGMKFERSSRSHLTSRLFVSHGVFLPWSRFRC